MDNDELIYLRNVLNSDFGFETIYRICKELGAFENGLSRQTTTKEDYLIIGKREKGRWLLDCVYRASNQKFLDMLLQAKKEK